MLLEEARIVSQINHPNVVNIYDVGTDRGVHYIGMEYLRGVNLYDVQLQLQRLDRRCPYDLAAAIIGQGCLGLHAAHEARDVSGRQLGIVHRDFTPTNLVISPEGDVKLIDFGVARAVGRQYLSKDGQFVGKPAYASPEQILHPRQVTRTSDIFSAAIVLYELCSGKSLFMRDNTHATLFSVINDAVPPLHDIPKDMWSLLKAALTKDPAHRLQTGVAMATQLEQIVLDEEGLWSHQGERFQNPALIALFSRSLVRTPGGTWLVHIPPFSYPVEVRDTPYYVRSARCDGDRVVLHLSDDSEERLDPATLRYVEGRGLYCRVKTGDGPGSAARLLRPAYFALSSQISEEPGGFFFTLAGQRSQVREVSWQEARAD